MILTKPELPFRLAAEAESNAAKFYDYLRDRAGDRRLAERISVFMHQWDVLSDELERPPAPQEYAARWGVAPATAYRQYAEFNDVFPNQDSPERALRLLWDGLSASRTRHLFSVRVVPVPIVLSSSTESSITLDDGTVEHLFTDGKGVWKVELPIRHVMHLVADPATFANATDEQVLAEALRLHRMGRRDWRFGG